MSKHSVTIRGVRVVTTCWSRAWSNRNSPSKWVGLGSPLAACSVYRDLICSVHTVNSLCMFNCQCQFYLCNRGPYVRLAFVPNMLSSWNKDYYIIIITMRSECIWWNLCLKFGFHWHDGRDGSWKWLMQGSLLYDNWACCWIVHLRALFCLSEVSNFPHGPWMKSYGPVFK